MSFFGPQALLLSRLAPCFCKWLGESSADREHITIHTSKLLESESLMPLSPPESQLQSLAPIHPRNSVSGIVGATDTLAWSSSEAELLSSLVT